MRTCKIQAIQALAVAMSPAFGRDNHKEPVTVYVSEDHGAVSGSDAGAAETLAERMFAAIGVQIAWRHREPSEMEQRTEHAIVVRIRVKTPQDEHPGALAFASLSDGVHIQVFYDRISPINPPRTATILAHVLVHEIAHILQACEHHAETGIMKPSWSAQDYYQMLKKPLLFTSSDEELIRQGLARR